MHRFLSTLAVTTLVTLATAQSPLSTTFLNNNGGAVGGGVYFDINVLSPGGITITQIDVNSAAASGSLDVLTIPGTRTGFQTNVGAWTGPASLNNPITTLGAGVPSPCILATPLTLPFGSHGIAFRANGFAHSYTNGNGANQNYGNADLTLAAGEASNIAFTGGLFTPRVVNCNIHYTPGSGSGTLLATATAYGTGCVASFGSFYENFPGPHDLAGLGMTMLNTGTGYLVLPATTTYVPPSGTATALALTDDSETSVALPSAMPIAGGTTSNLTVCSNGFVSVATGNGVGFTPASATMLGNPQTAWYCWHDYNPAVAGSGQVKFEVLNNIAYVTWDGVFDFGQTTGGSTFQFQFELATGHVHVLWVSNSGLGNGHLMGYSPGGASVDPGNRDLSATLPGAFTVGSTDIAPLQLAVSPRPIVNTPIVFTTSNITPTTPFGAVAIGLTQFGTPVDLTPLGMATCFQYHDILATFLYLPFGAASVNTAFNVPNMVGLTIQAQSYNYDPAAGLTTLGAVSSRAFRLLLGDY